MKDENDGLWFFKGLAFAIPIGIVLWAAIIYLILLAIK